MHLLSEDIYWRGDHGTRSTHRLRSALIGSLLFHCTLGGLATAVVLQQPVMQEPVMIDLTAASLPEAEMQSQPSRLAVGSRMSRLSPAKPVPILSPPVSVPVPATAAMSNPAKAQTLLQVPDNAAGSAYRAEETETGGNGTGGSTGTGGAGKAASETVETLQTRYLREHFAYIRDLIGKELRYPKQAIRMGWSGQATVSFVVLVDGTVTELKIRRSSGVPLLDHNALETVERAAPFPKPPVSARLLVPVSYILE